MSSNLTHIREWLKLNNYLSAWGGSLRERHMPTALFKRAKSLIQNSFANIKWLSIDFCVGVGLVDNKVHSWCSYELVTLCGRWASSIFTNLLLKNAPQLYESKMEKLGRQIFTDKTYCTHHNWKWVTWHKQHNPFQNISIARMMFHHSFNRLPYRDQVKERHNSERRNKVLVKTTDRLWCRCFGLFLSSTWCPH